MVAGGFLGPIGAAIGGGLAAWQVAFFVPESHWLGGNAIPVAPTRSSDNPADWVVRL
jgi:hypothetical protein